MSQKKHNTTAAASKADDRTAKVLQFPSRPNMRARVSSDCEKQDLTGAGLADLFAAIFAHDDLDEELGHALHQVILDHTEVSTVSVEYLQLALRGA